MPEFHVSGLRNLARAGSALIFLILLQGCGGGSSADAPPPAGNNQLRSAELSWNAPAANTDGTLLSDLAGYRVYYGTSASLRNRTVDVNNPTVTTFVVENLQPDVYFFSVRAVNANDVESADSNVVSADLR